MPHDFFGEEVAASYDEHVADMFAPASITPAVDLLAELSGGRAARGSN